MMVHGRHSLGSSGQRVNAYRVAIQLLREGNRKAYHARFHYSSDKSNAIDINSRAISPMSHLQPDPACAVRLASTHRPPHPVQQAA